MKDELIQKISQILAEWNPLGDKASEIPDLDNYKIEATDILSQFEMQLRNESINEIVTQILNQAFDLSLSKKECYRVSKKIKKAINQAGL